MMETGLRQMEVPSISEVDFYRTDQCAKLMKMPVESFLSACKRYGIKPVGRVKLGAKKTFKRQYVYFGVDIKKLFYRMYLKG